MTANTLDPIFLSASIPDRPPFVETSDPVLIQEAVLALVATVIRSRHLIFGGHPAISPLVEHAARTLDALDHVIIYQSRWFENVIPPVARQFVHLRWTDRGESRESSLRIMREQMIGGHPFRAAIFIGGMEGIYEEHQLFRQFHPDKPTFPIASTQGATLELWSRGEGPTDESLRRELRKARRYRKLFRRLMEPT